MSERPRARRPKRPSLLAVIGASVAAFGLVLVLLGAQMRLGRDPALRIPASTRAAPAPRRVLLRRVIVKRVVVQIVRDDGGEGSPARTVVPVPQTPVTPTPVPASPAAPAAPLVTKSS